MPRNPGLGSAPPDTASGVPDVPAWRCCRGVYGHMGHVGARVARAGSRWLTAPLLVLAVLLTACSGSTPTAGSVDGSTAAGSPDAPGVAVPGPAGSGGASPSTVSGTSASKSAGRPGS